MKGINNNILIDKFLENSMSGEEKKEFNEKYKTDKEFAGTVNSYLNIISAIKAADRLKSGKRLQKQKTGKYILTKFNYFSAAASVLLLISISIALYKTVQLRKAEKEITKAEQKIHQLYALNKSSSNMINPDTSTKTNSLNNVNQVTNEQDIDFSTLLALNTITDDLKDNEWDINQRNNKITVFSYPTNSKLANKNDAVLYIKAAGLEKDCYFTIINKASDDTIWTQKLISPESAISFERINIIRGEKYYWMVTKEANVVDVGTITYLSGKELSKFNSFNYDTKNDYLKAYLAFYDNNCFFDAYSVLKKATEKYPSEKLFVYLLDLYGIEF